jgi:hypothetical protein
VWHTNSKEENEILYTRFLEKNKDFSDSMINVTGTKCDVLRMKRLEISLVNVIAQNNISKNTAKILNINYATTL